MPKPELMPKDEQRGRPWRCAVRTHAGTQCLRFRASGSYSYCRQHLNALRRYERERKESSHE